MAVESILIICFPSFQESDTWLKVSTEHYAPTDDANVHDDDEVDYEDNNDGDLMNKCKPLQTISTATSRPQDH